MAVLYVLAIFVPCVFYNNDVMRFTLSLARVAAQRGCMLPQYLVSVISDVNGRAKDNIATERE